MTHSRRQTAGSGRRGGLVPALLALLVLLAPAAGRAWVDLGASPDAGMDAARGILITDGSYVMNVGELQMNVTNFGLIGSQAGSTCRWCDAPSAQWPAGSGVEYLWAAGLWVGGVLLGEKFVTTGAYAHEFLARDDIRDTIYEAINGRITRPAGNPDASGKRLPEPGADDDEDGLMDEETLNGYDDDDDGLIDEDFGQVGNQMMVCTMYDNLPLVQELNPDHTPLNLKIVQSAYAWENDDADDFVAYEFEITNIGVTDIDDVYIGFFADCDIGPLSQAGRAEDDMGGSFRGVVRARDNSFVPIEVGYMYDDDGDNGQAPGYIGILFLGYTTDPSGQTAPPTVGLRSFNLFSGQQAFDQGGDPTNDAERYELLSGTEFDQNTVEGKQNDFRMLISGGPFARLEPDKTLKFEAAFVLGNGLEGMLKNAAEAALTWYGNYFNMDGDADTGVNGRETRICARDFGSGSGDNPIFHFVADLMDATCVDPAYLQGQPTISAGDLDEEQCIYVNMDNCFECVRQTGQVCTPDNHLIETQWNCWNPSVPDREKKGCTGIGGNETQIHWLVGMAPPPPGMRLWPTDNAVHVFWDDRSEITPDVRSNRIDFESYRIWRADNWDRPYGSSVENGPGSNLWHLIAEYDLVDYYQDIRLSDSGDTISVQTLPLGPNTGLDVIRYRPRVLDDPRYAGLAEAMQQVVDADSTGRLSELPPVFDRLGNVNPGMEPLIPWAGEKAVLDTFFMVTPREAIRPTIVPKHATQFYEYVDTEVHNGFIYFYSVTAGDRKLVVRPDNTEVTIGEGQAGDPGSAFSVTTPGTAAQTAAERDRLGANIYVYPNPATREALAEFQELHPNADDPTGVRVCFTNLPAARDRIDIFTLDGDLVQTIDHDGTGGDGEACWNLVSRNGQEIVSGIYLFVVHADDSRFEDFIGKFVVIR